MESDLSPQVADATVYDGDGGAYYAWTSAKSPVLSEAKLGAGKLVLQPLGFALPHYANGAKIGYVVQGSCTVGLISPNAPEENVLIINKGEAIPVPLGTVSWWYNGGDSDVVIVFLGETSAAYTPGNFEYFFLTGAIGTLGGFSTEVTSKTYNISKEEAETVAKSQPGALIVKLNDDIKMPDQHKGKKEKLACNLGHTKTAYITAENFPVLKQVGLSAKVVKIGASDILAALYTVDKSYQIFYVIKGSGKVQIVGLNGQQVLDAELQEGQLFVVPKFFAATLVANEDGLECFSVITSPEPLFGEYAGKASVLRALAPAVLQASLNVTPGFTKLFRSKIE